MDNAVLIIFIKNPERGKVKTRLAQSVGEDKALQIYQALLAHTRQTALALPLQRQLFYSSFLPPQDDWPTTHFQKFVQQGDSLGQRMQQAFAQANEQFNKMVIIGSDCPTLTPAILQSAFDQLDQHPFVLGPAEDGGYYLLGMREYQANLFENIEWSTSTVFQRTCEQIEALGASYALLPTLSDVDYLSDWEQHGWALED